MIHYVFVLLFSQISHSHLLQKSVKIASPFAFMLDKTGKPETAKSLAKLVAKFSFPEMKPGRENHLMHFKQL